MIYTQISLTFAILALSALAIMKADGSEKIYHSLQCFILAVFFISVIGAPVLAIIAIWQ
jgi:hypothetical protein